MKRISDSEKKEKYIEKYSLVASLPPTIIERLELQFFEKGEFLLLQGEKLNNIYFLLEGKLQVGSLHPDGRQVIISFDTPFSIIGELELLNNQKIITDVLTFEDSLVFATPASVVREFGLSDLTFLRFMIQCLAKKLYFDVPLMMQSTMSAEKRLAGYLLQLYSERNGYIRLENREVIASLLGLSIRHLNRNLRLFAQAGIITKSSKTVQIVEPDKLRNILESGT